MTLIFCGWSVIEKVSREYISLSLWHSYKLNVVPILRLYEAGRMVYIRRSRLRDWK